MKCGIKNRRVYWAMSCCQMARTISCQNVNKCNADTRRNSQANIVLSASDGPSFHPPGARRNVRRISTARISSSRASWSRASMEATSRFNNLEDFSVGCITADYSQLFLSTLLQVPLQFRAHRRPPFWSNCFRHPGDLSFGQSATCP